jgi:hypothetical protein
MKTDYDPQLVKTDVKSYFFYERFQRSREKVNKNTSPQAFTFSLLYLHQPYLLAYRVFSLDRRI